MVDLAFHRIQARVPVWIRAFSHVSVLGLFLLSGCATSDSSRLKESREAYLSSDFGKAEAALYSPEVFKHPENRLEHFLMLSSIAMSEGAFEKAIYYLQKSREVSNSVRSDHSGFNWFNSEYGGNPIEFSYVHYFLVMAYQLSAESGGSQAWSTPEIRDEHGNTLVPSQSFVARKYSAKEIADFQVKARAELLAWDSHLESLKRSFKDQPSYYQEDLWARLLGSYVHGSSDLTAEKRTAEILAEQAVKILQRDSSRLPTLAQNREAIETLSKKLKARSASPVKDAGTLFVCQAGVVSPYKIQRFHIGMSTLFKNIEDPYLRAQMEQIGFRVLLQFAPEFGLVAFTGGLLGAITGSSDDESEEGPPRFFTDAVDNSFGFEVSFPKLVLPPSDTRVTLSLSSEKNGNFVFPLPVVSPLQEIIAEELKARERSEMFPQALKVGFQYLAILVPAIKAYQAADREGNGFKKLAILAGYYLAKKAIDRANRPDLRSWNLLPQVLAADYITGVTGDFDAKLSFQTQNGTEWRDIGKMSLGQGSVGIIWKQIGLIPIMNPNKAGTRGPDQR